MLYDQDQIIIESMRNKRLQEIEKEKEAHELLLRQEKMQNA